jgi:hypothetical protein
MRDPFRAVPVLLLSAPDSELLTLLREANELLERQPRVLDLIEEDLDRHSKVKKALRLRDGEWRQARSEGLPTVALKLEPVEPDKLRLGIGRPRTSAYVVYMFLVGRGFYGAFKSSEAMTLLQESTTLTVFLRNHGSGMPGLSTLNELVNAVSNETREQILDAQLRAVLDEGWDDFSKLTQDSTAVEGNTQWPKDSHLMVCLVERLLHRGARIERLGLPPIDEPRASEVLGKMRVIDKRISMGASKPGGAGERKAVCGCCAWRAELFRCWCRT